ncbi:hypothetical protein LDENG_00123160 [Lucifuga dentata]|nr:hypothetical protein LDENG_00123160 [Lucifuga dentata]
MEGEGPRDVEKQEKEVLISDKLSLPALEKGCRRTFFFRGGIEDIDFLLQCSSFSKMSMESLLGSSTQTPSTLSKRSEKNVNRKREAAAQKEARDEALMIPAAKTPTSQRE